jgi:hypothetical protein
MAREQPAGTGVRPVLAPCRNGCLPSNALKGASRANVVYRTRKPRHAEAGAELKRPVERSGGRRGCRLDTSVRTVDWLNRGWPAELLLFCRSGVLGPPCRALRSSDSRQYPSGVGTSFAVDHPSSAEPSGPNSVEACGHYPPTPTCTTNIPDRMTHLGPERHGTNCAGEMTVPPSSWENIIRQLVPLTRSGVCGRGGSPLKSVIRRFQSDSGIE